MNPKHITISLLIGIAIGIVLMVWLRPEPESIPVIKKVTEYKTVWKQAPQTKCEGSEIYITHEMRGDTLHIEAGDACKSKTEDILMECRTKPDYKGYGLSALGGAAVVVGLIILF